jgi:uncharacterized protein
MSTATSRPIEVTCPTCGETTLFSPANPFRPFCSARCQGQDFGAWANEAYRVEAPPTTEDEDEAER